MTFGCMGDGEIPSKIAEEASTLEQKQDIVRRLYEVWVRYPDFRLAQLIALAVRSDALLDIEDDRFAAHVEFFADLLQDHSEWQHMLQKESATDERHHAS